MSATVYLRGEEPWTHAEDGVLSAAIMKYGLNSWNHVASLLPHRNSAQCKQRWYQYLSPAINVGAWSATEDSKLRKAVLAFPGRWETIAVAVGRTAFQCQQRYSQIQGELAPLTGADVAVEPARGGTKDAVQSQIAVAESRLAPGGMSSKQRRLMKERIAVARARENRGTASFKREELQQLILPAIETHHQEEQDVEAQGISKEELIRRATLLSDIERRRISQRLSSRRDRKAFDQYLRDMQSGGVTALEQAKLSQLDLSSLPPPKITSYSIERLGSARSSAIARGDPSARYSPIWVVPCGSDCTSECSMNASTELSNYVRTINDIIQSAGNSNLDSPSDTVNVNDLEVAMKIIEETPPLSE